MEPESESDHSTWNVIYPTYLDKEATTTQGRKVNLSIAVPKPTLEEIKLVLERLNVPHVVERQKRYPRNWLVPGRVRVCLRDQSTKEKTRSSKKVVRHRRSEKQLLNEVATLIAQLKTRQQPKQPAPAPSTSSGKKKAGKKKR